MRALAGLFEVLTAIGAAVGAMLLFAGLTPGQTAIQTGASAATALAFAAIPYCVAGCLHRVAMRGLMTKSIDAQYDPEDVAAEPVRSSGAQPTMMQRLWWNSNASN